MTAITVSRQLRAPGWSLVTRGLWLAVLGLQVVVFVLGLGIWYGRMQQPCADTAEVCQQQLRLSAAEAQALESQGWSLRAYANYNLVTRALMKALAVGLGALIFRRRPADRMVFVASLFLVIGLETSIVDALVAVNPAWWLPTRVLAYLGGLCFALFFYLFPNGQFVPRWTRWLALVWTVSYGTTTFFPNSPLSLNQAGPALAGPFVFLFFGSFIGAQVYRYRVVSTSIERLQTQWVVFATAIGLATFLVTILPIWLSAGSEDGLITPYWILQDLGIQLTFIVIPLAIALAVLRYRLFDIDVIIRRTLVYSILTALLALVYFGSVLLLQGLLRGVTGDEAPIVIVLSTLLIAALAAPLRARVQRAIDQRFYRRKYDAARTLAAFGEQARDETDLGRLSDRLTGVVQETMQPERVSLWLRTAADRGRKQPNRNGPQAGAAAKSSQS